MEPKITDKKDYILVELREPGYWEIWESLGKRFQMSKEGDKNAIWLIHDGPLKTTYDDLYKIKNFLKENFPENAKPDKKVAIVASTGLLTAMATEYTRMAADLPVEYKVFSDLDAAEEWITG